MNRLYKRGLQIRYWALFIEKSRHYGIVILWTLDILNESAFKLIWLCNTYDSVP